MFPLDLLPAPVFHALKFLPFYYQMYFPAAIFTGRLSFADAESGLGLELGWVLVLLALTEFLWRRGLRRHTAVGG
jgi:ABC-2 type transport system permease protein